MTMVGMPCDMMMPAASVDHGKPVAPCKDMMPDCSKLTGCVAGIALPTRLVATEFAAQVSAVEYWPAKSERSGLASTPEPNPPRAT